MNWLDIVIIVILALALLWGMKTGLLGAVVSAVAVLVGWLLAGQYGDDVGELFGDSLSNDTLVTVVSYAIIIVASLVVARIVWRILRPILTIATLGLTGMVDKLGGLVLGLVVGVVISGALVMGMARFTYDFEVPEIPDLSGIPGGSVTGALEERLPDPEETRQAVEDALTESAIVPVFIDITDALPADAFGFVPSDFKAALDILDKTIEEADSS